MIHFFVPGVPQPGGSKRAFASKSGRIIVMDDCKGNKDWKSTVKVFAQQAFAGKSPLAGPLRLAIVFHLLRPKGHFGRGKNSDQIRASAPMFPTVKPDATKLLRSTEDAMTGVIWRDDAQIVEQIVRKIYSDTTGADVVIEEMP